MIALNWNRGALSPRLSARRASPLLLKKLALRSRIAVFIPREKELYAEVGGYCATAGKLKEELLRKWKRLVIVKGAKDG